MAEVVVFPDVEALLALGYYNAQFPSYAGFETVKAGTKPPPTFPAAKKFLVVRRTGGTRGLVIDNPQITLEAWAEKAIDAMALMQLARGLFFSIDRVTFQGRTHQFYDPQEFSGPANLPDPDSAWERYTETASVGVRGYTV